MQDCRSVSNSTWFECISQPRDTQSTKLTFGSRQYREICGGNFKNPTGTILSHHNLRISRIFSGHLTRRYDKNLVVNWETICQRSTSMRWSGEHLCPQQLKQRYKMFKKIYVPPRARISRRSNNFLKDICDSSDQELKKRGTERTPTNQTVYGTMLLI